MGDERQMWLVNYELALPYPYKHIVPPLASELLRGYQLSSSEPFPADPIRYGPYSGMVQQVLPSNKSVLNPIAWLEDDHVAWLYRNTFT